MVEVFFARTRSVLSQILALKAHATMAIVALLLHLDLRRCQRLQCRLLALLVIVSLI
jgi:hypothetical protein